MRGGGHARKTDRRGESVSEDWHPAMVFIATGNNCGHGKHARRMTRREAAAFERGLASGEEGVVIRPSRRYSRRSFPARHGLNHEVNDGAVGISFARQHGRV